MNMLNFDAQTFFSWADVPVASISGPEKKQDGGLLFRATIQSVPAPFFVQWSLKEKSCDTFIPIDEHVEEFKGTSNNLPEPVLVIRPKYDLENYCFQIEVRNFIGSCKQIVTGRKVIFFILLFTYMHFIEKVRIEPWTTYVTRECLQTLFLFIHLNFIEK